MDGWIDRKRDEESAGSGSSDWYREAEVKHEAVAILAAVSAYVYIYMCVCVCVPD